MIFKMSLRNCHKKWRINPRRRLAARGSLWQRVSSHDDSKNGR